VLPARFSDETGWEPEGGERIDVSDELIRETIATGRPYVLFLYNEGPNRNQPPADAEKLQMEHLRYLFRLRAEGRLVLNGPVDDETKLKGIGILDTRDTEEVKRLVEQDPAVKAGRLTFEIHLMFGIPGDSLPG
jgi:uncharacterized protein YciI